MVITIDMDTPIDNESIDTCYIIITMVIVKNMKIDNHSDDYKTFFNNPSN